MKKYPEHIKLQVPIAPEVYESLKKRSKDLGFDSIQAHVRFWAKGETNQQGNPQDLKQPNAQALRYLELLLATNEKEPETIEEALEYVLKELQRAKGLRYAREHLY